MDFQRLMQVPIFAGMQQEEIRSVIQCFGAQTKHFGRGEVIILPGEEIRQIGIVLTGQVLVERDDYWGNRSIVASIGEGEAFAETFACLPGVQADIRVVAVQPSEVLLLHAQKVLTLCPSACPFHQQMVRNLLRITAKKNQFLSMKLDILSRKTTREKLLAYLSAQSRGNSSFTIPFNRQQLADFLSVDRSAMTVELSKPKREGVIDFSRNTFFICR